MSSANPIPIKFGNFATASDCLPKRPRLIKCVSIINSGINPNPLYIVTAPLKNASEALPPAIISLAIAIAPALVPAITKPSSFLYRSAKIL